MTKRPTPTDGWTAVPSQQKAPQSSQSQPEKASGPAARAPIQTKKTLVGLPAASFFGQPANLPPPTAHASAARALSSTPQLGPREHDETHEVSLADMSLASFSANVEAQARSEATQDVSLQELSLASQKAANDATPVIHAASHEQLSFASTMPPAPAPAAAGSKRYLWALAGVPLLLGAGFWLLSGRSAPHEPPPPLAMGAVATPAAGAPAERPAQPEPTSARDAKQTAEPEKGAPSADVSPGSPDAQLAARKRADAQVAQANGLRKRRKLGPARSKYQAALGSVPGHEGALQGLALIAMQQRDGKQAVELARQLVAAAPDQLSHQVLLGDAYKLAGKPKDAREVWQAAARKGSSAARKRLK